MRTNMLLVSILLLGLIIPQTSSQAVNLVGSLIYTNGSGAHSISAAYNAYSNEHMAVWMDVTAPYSWQLKGQRFNATTGNLVGSEFYVCDNPSVYSTTLGEVIYNSTNHEWFVVYKAGVGTDNEDVFGQRYDSGGNPIGGHISLVVKSGYQNDTHVAHDSTNNRYLVTWKEKISGGELQTFCRLFDSTGSPLTSYTRLSEVDNRMHWTALPAYNPIYNEYMVVWEDMRNLPDGVPQDNPYKDIYGQRIDANGAKIGTNIPIYVPLNPSTNPNGQDNLGGFVCNPTDGKYAMGITKLTAASNYDTYGMVFDRFGNSANGVFVVYAPTGEDIGFKAWPAYNPVSNTYYFTSRDATNWVMGMEVSAVGMPINPAEYLFAPGVGIRSPVLSIRPSDGQYCSVMNLENGNVVAQRFTTTPDTIPPGPVINFIATPGGNATNTLSWTNPSESDYTGVMIRYQTNGAYPVDENDGELAVDKAGTPNSNDSYVHERLEQSLTYYYAAFAHDGTPNYAGGVHTQAQPYPPGDFDFDRDVDQEDCGRFQACLSGDGVLLEPGCEYADLQGDNDVDEFDFDIFYSCMAGPNNPPGCYNPNR
ncbi:MAG: hypothetical protein JSV03_01940 [Planctomycetota bacterium]|nr:MAG: hypothetical protein JSV03_01940 [Planctomycetota bacterium]